MKSNLITSEIAEIAGIHAGDGYLRYGRKNEWDVSGSYEEKEYYDGYVIPLINKFFQTEIKGRYFYSRKTYGFCTGNKKIIQTLVDLGFPSGNKSTIVEIPKQVLNSHNKNNFAAFLRGYFDTDGSLNFRNKVNNSDGFKKKYHFYPRLAFASCSKKLICQVGKLLEKFDLSYNIYEYNSKVENENVRYNLESLGIKNLNSFMEHIDSKNSSKISRYLIWEKFGFCPPKTKYKQRKQILSRKIDIHNFYD